MSELIAVLERSGWNRCESIRTGLEKAGLPVPNRRYLEKAFSAKQWKRAQELVERLRAHFRAARFADAATFGVLLVPDPAKLDTRGALATSIRRSQSEDPLVDYVDKRLPKGKTVTPAGQDWTLVATITSAAGVFLGSYDDIQGQSRTDYAVAGVDTRKMMVRQLWGARVLQAGRDLPDSSIQDAWTFTLFPGEELTGGAVASGTILHGKVRFRLGRTDRGISSARVCPAVLVD